MKKRVTLFFLTTLTVCGLSLVGCKQKTPAESANEAAATEKPVPTSPEAILSLEAKPAAEATKPVAEQAATNTPKDHPAH